MVTPLSTVLRAATGVTIPYMADVGVAWVWLTLYASKESHSQGGFLPVTVVTIIWQWGHMVMGNFGEAHTVTSVAALVRRVLEWYACLLRMCI